MPLRDAGGHAVGDRPGHGPARDGDAGEVHRLGDLADGSHDPRAVHLRAVRVDDHQVPGKAVLAQVTGHEAADLESRAAAADQRDAAGGDEPVHARVEVARRAAAGRGPQRAPGVGGERPRRGHEDGVQVEFGYLGNRHGELADRRDQFRERPDVKGRRAPVAVEQVGRPQRGDHAVRLVRGDGRHLPGRVVEQLDQGAAGGDHDHRPELVPEDPDGHLDAAQLLLHAQDRAAQPQCPAALQEVRGGRGQFLVIHDRAPDQAELGLVEHGGVEQLAHDRVLDGPGGGQCLFDARRGNRGPERDDAREQRPALRLAQPHAAVAVGRAARQQCPRSRPYAGKHGVAGRPVVSREDTVLPAPEARCCQKTWWRLLGWAVDRTCRLLSTWAPMNLDRQTPTSAVVPGPPRDGRSPG